MRKRTYGQSASARVRSAPPKKSKISKSIAALNNRVRYPMQDRAQSTTTVLRWSDLGRQVDPGIAGCGAYVYTLNGLYDPNTSGIGDQPTGFDQYMQLYDKYVVQSVKVKVKVLNGDTTYPQIAGATIAGYSTTSTDPNVYVRNGTPEFHILSTLGSGNNIREWSFDVDIAQLSKTNINIDSEFSGIVSANPVNQWHLHIWNGSHDVSANATACFWQVEFDYLVRFSEPVTTPNS